MSTQAKLFTFFSGKRKNDENDQSKDNSVCSTDDGELSKTASVKRESKFLSSWLDKFKWLRYKDDKMVCDICISAKSSTNPFTEGCINFQLN